MLSLSVAATPLVRISGLPCNLNTVPIIEYILAQFALLKPHATVTNYSSSNLGNTVTSYKCAAWCVAVQAIQKMPQVKVVPKLAACSHLYSSLFVSLKFG
jgi:hypothetical protein